MKKRIAAAAVCLCLIILALQSVSAGKISSLFWNDEVWYRDAMSPLAVRDGEYYIPTGLVEMFDYISVRTPKDNNLLVYNRENGGYISVLTGDGTAAVDGEIIECAVFRESGTYYIPAELACSVLSLNYDTYTDAYGNTALRVYDTHSSFSLGELAEKNRLPDQSGSDGSSAVSGTVTESRKRIYILCESGMMPLLDRYGLEYTVFLGEDDGEDEIFSSLLHGEYGAVYPGDTAALEELNERIKEYTFTDLYAVLSDAGEDENSAIVENGYAIITPDITVDERMYTDTAIDMIIEHLNEHESITVKLCDTWSGKETARRISELEGYGIITENIRYGE